MIELVYVSHSQHNFSEPQLLELLEHARKNNAHLNVTGLLLYDNKGTFIQALEGDEEQVDSLFNKIREDKRHNRVNRISRKNIKSRAFPDWKMGFKVIDEHMIQNLSGYSECMQSDNSIKGMTNSASIAVDLLNYFKREEQQTF